jgi:hypothetical protein
MRRVRIPGSLMKGRRIAAAPGSIEEMAKMLLLPLEKVAGGIFPNGYSIKTEKGFLRLFLLKLFQSLNANLPDHSFRDRKFMLGLWYRRLYRHYQYGIMEALLS